MNHQITHTLNTQMKPIHNLLTDKNILIVEDDKATAFLITQLLRPTNANTICVSCDNEIEDIINSGFDIHLVIMGILRKDGMQGAKLIKQFKKAYSIAPVIVQTAFTSFEIKEKCFESGCDVFFLKPWSCDELLKSIQELCSYVS